MQNGKFALHLGLLQALRSVCAAPAQGLKHEESGSEDEWTEDEEEGTALQDIEPFSVVADTLRGVQAHNPARFQARVVLAFSPQQHAGSFIGRLAGAGRQNACMECTCLT